MAHEITIRKDGKAEAAYANEPAWHKLGTVVKGTMNAEDAFKTAHLDWEVEKKPVLFERTPQEGELIVEGERGTFPNRFVTIRTDNSQPLGLVSDKYKIVQNIEAFSFMDSLITEGGLEYMSAGSFKGGKKVWLLAKFPKEHAISEDDVIHDYLALFTSHDSSTPITVIPTKVRIVCWNTLQIAIADAQQANNIIRMKHTNNIQLKIEETKQLLGLYGNALLQANDILKNLAEIRVEKEDYIAFLDRMFPLPVTKDEKYYDTASAVYTKQTKIRNKITTNFLYDSRQATKAANQTAYGLLNAVTQYVDHDRSTKGKSNEERFENRISSSWIGSGARFKNEALVTINNLFKKENENAEKS